MTNHREEKFNMRLASLLMDEGLDAKGEEEQPSGIRIDVLVYIDERRIAVEAKKGTLPRNRDKAFVNAAQRLDQGVADAAVAVCYPELSDCNQLTTDTRLWAAPLGGVWSETDTQGLAAVIRRTSDDLTDIEQASITFRDKLKEASTYLSNQQVYDIATSVNIPLGSGQPGLRAALLVASACLFHARLDEAFARDEIQKPRIDARTKTRYDDLKWPFLRLTECLAEPDSIGALDIAWNTILAVDYKPVFETALAVIQAPVTNRNVTMFVRGCGYAAIGATRTLTQGQTDLLGRVFHRILDEARHTGAFYTSSAAAALLAGIAIRDEDVSNDLDYQIIDPACGTGTLLAAAASRIKEIAGQHGKAAGKHLIEEGIHGYDIDIAATHMAAVTLGLMSPGVAFRNMNIHRFHLGRVEDPVSGGTVVSAGSLELMDGNGLAQVAGWPQAIRSGQVETEQEEVIELVSRDLVIMNPPFTRDSLRHGQLNASAKKDLKDREKSLFVGTPVHRSHYGGMFLMLAHRLCDKETGTLALVYPTSSCGAPSARREWHFLLENFHLEMVVTSHDPERIYFSENTDINESLFVLRRKDTTNQHRDTRFIQLLQNPRTAADAVLLADTLQNGQLTEQYGSEVSWPSKRLLDNDWTPVKYLSPYLVKTTHNLFSIRDIGLVPLGRIAKIGPAGQALRSGVFRPHRIADSFGRRAMWYNNQKRPSGTGTPPKHTIKQEPDCYIHANPTKQPRAADLWNQRSSLLLTAKFRLTTVHTFALISTEPVLGSYWIPISPLMPMEGWKEAMAIYLNSTVGILAQIRVSSPKLTTRQDLSIDGMRSLLVPKLTPDHITALVAVYEEICEQPLQRLCNITNDSERLMLDEAICDVLELNTELVGRVRSELAAEPSVTGLPAGERC